ncbi:L-idonate 5-dehydrogenase [Rhodovulum sp. DZ06]|uniref:L-idonate 5-dehydrogenase n=1 Tax=Rhodovulum sp. DZ06 TaxID=3425126 RepID=UPI003D332EE6
METRVCRLHAVHDLRVESEPVAPPAAGQVLLRLRAGGICGSDLHYFHEGGIGAIRVREPIILGHEAAGEVEALGEGVEGLKPGQLVAINPSRPCGECRFCAEGTPRQCLSMRFNGSAMFLPHTQGLFRERIVVDAAQCVPMAPGVSASAAACTEPLAVCLHARNLAGDLSGKRVLVTGAGPIGALCVALAKSGGAEEVVVTDLQDAVLDVAAKMGADKTVNVLSQADALAPYAEEKGAFDVAFECSGAGPAIKTCLETLRPGGTLMQVGMAGEATVPLGMLVAKEIKLRGAFRFDREFAAAAGLISSGAIDVTPMVTGTFPLSQAKEAFETAGDRTRAVKVHLSF